MAATEVERITLTGNPFVDTGLGVIASLGKLDDVQELTLDTIRTVHGDGSQLANWSARLKSFSQIFGTNNPLFQTRYGYQKGRGPSPKNFAIYRRTLQHFLDAIAMESPGHRCEACGVPSSFDFAQACIEAVAEVGGKTPEDKWIGRDWFPLAGSLGNDAQALPAGSRTVHLCAKCLFAVHYLPLGVVLLDRRLAVFQSTSIAFWYELVRDIVNEVHSRINAGNHDTLGSKEGSRAVIRRLLAVFERLQRAGRVQSIPQGTTLQAWYFSNSGASPECNIAEIPNPALVFLWKAVEHGLREEAENLVAREGRRERPLFRCIVEGRDYPGLYPKGKTQGASPSLFALYQTHVCHRSRKTLAIALALAREGTRGLKPNEIKRLQREEVFSERANRNRFRGLMTLMAQKRQFTLDDYLDLFPSTDDDLQSADRSDADGWNIIRYYLHHCDESEVDSSESTSGTRTSAKLATLRYYAAMIFDNYVGERGRERFQSEVLNQLGRGDVGISWLKRQFVLLAEKHSGFTYGAWEILCKNGSGHRSVSELLFQIRLLWSEWIGETYFARVEPPCLSDDSGLPRAVEVALTEAFTQYVQRRGLDRFQRDVLARLRRNEIDLSWFRHRLVSENGEAAELAPFSIDDWEDFLRDQDGRSYAGERLFQMQLFLANLYREAQYSQIREGV